MSETGLSDIIPVYNEEEGLRQTLQQIQSLLNSSRKIEIIIIDDGSSDTKTIAILNEVNIAGIKVVKHSINKGYGASLKTGLAKAQYDYIAITDADGTYPNERIPEFEKIARENNLDMVIGARKGENVYIPWMRRFPKWCLSRLADYIARCHIPDMNSGLRIIRKATLERYLSILPDGFSFTSTITLATTVNGHQIKFINIDYYKRKGHSKISPIYDTLNFINLIIKIMVYFDRRRIFTPIGMLLFIIGGTAGLMGKAYAFTVNSLRPR